MYGMSSYKIFGSVAVAVVTGYEFWRRSRPISAEFAILDPEEAVNNLNNGHLLKASTCCLEALRHFDDGKFSSRINKLNDAAWCELAIQGSPLCKFLPRDEVVNMSDAKLHQLLDAVELDRDWNKAIRWYSLNICREDDLYCQDSPHMFKRSRLKRVSNLLQVLLYKSEMDDCRKFANQDVPSILLNFFYNFRCEEHKNLVILILKILANIAATKNCTESIIHCGWLPILAEMIANPVLKEEPVLAHKVLANMMYAMGNSHYKIPPNVFELHRPCAEEEPVLDVIFVHGFRGSVFRTWRQKDNPKIRTTQFWPRDWIPIDIERPIRILGLDYTSQLLKFGRVFESVSDRSRSFQAALKAADVGNRPVVFICHSMGGLLVKHMLAENEELRKKTVGILFMATPHRGTPVISAYLDYLRPTDDIRLLKVDSSTNKALNDLFLSVSSEIPLICTILEQKLTPLFGSQRVIVPPESGTIDKGAVYHVGEHHHNVCKPADSHSLSYCITLNFLKDALKANK